jgi:hypothetical protein
VNPMTKIKMQHITTIYAQRLWATVCHAIETPRHAKKIRRHVKKSHSFMQQNASIFGTSEHRIVGINQMRLQRSAATVVSAARVLIGVQRKAGRHIT